MEHNFTQIEVHCISHLLFNLGLFLKHSLPSYPFIDGPEGVTLKLANPTGVKGERPGTNQLWLAVPHGTFLHLWLAGTSGVCITFKKHISAMVAKLMAISKNCIHVQKPKSFGNICACWTRSGDENEPWSTPINTGTGSPNYTAGGVASSTLRFTHVPHLYRLWSGISNRKGTKGIWGNSDRGGMSEEHSERPQSFWFGFVVLMMPFKEEVFYVSRFVCVLMYGEMCCR